MSTQPEKIGPSLPGRDQFPPVHLLAAALTLLILIGAMIGADWLASSMEDQSINSLAPMLLPQTASGLVLQLAAYRRPDLLPVYGSSEMLNENTPFRAYDFFANYPTGFQVIDIAKGGDTSLDFAENLAALGPALKGKKVVISFTPSMFNFSEVPEGAYASNFSHIHAVGLIFNPYLGINVKQQAARRMLEYPETLTPDPILSSATYNLAAGNSYNLVLYDLSLPLGQLDFLINRMQDHYEVLNYLQNNRTKLGTPAKHIAQKIDWLGLISQSRQDQIANANNNPYGIENIPWIKQHNRTLETYPPGSKDTAYIMDLERSKEWGDLAILLEILHELGAQPLIMSRPLNGTLYNATGTSDNALNVYYFKLQDLVGSYNFPMVDFQPYTNDRYFSVDMASHTSREGWVIVDRTLDYFFHGEIH